MKILDQLFGSAAKPAVNDQFAGHYVDWRARRLAAIINHYGASFFHGKTLLEVGCGYADIGGVFAKLGAKVTCSDGRSEHLEIVQTRFPDVKVKTANLDVEWPFDYHDIVIHMGVLYHLGDYVTPLLHACGKCQHLILETEVADSDDPTFSIKTKEGGFDQAVGGAGIRPSADAIEKELLAHGMKFERIRDSRCNSGIHRYDWPVQNTKTWDHGLRRFWFAERTSPSA